MTVNKFITIVFAWIIAQFICLSVDGQVWGSSDGFRSILDQLTFYDFTSVNSLSGALNVIVNGSIDMFKLIGNMLVFNYSFLTGYMFIVRLILIGLSVGFFWGLFQTFRSNT